MSHPCFLSLILHMHSIIRSYWLHLKQIQSPATPGQFPKLLSSYHLPTRLLQTLFDHLPSYRFRWHSNQSHPFCEMLIIITHLGFLSPFHSERTPRAYTCPTARHSSALILFCCPPDSLLLSHTEFCVSLNTPVTVPFQDLSCSSTWRCSSPQIHLFRGPQGPYLRWHFPLPGFIFPL